ncbi:MAG: hypothetical protein INR65_07330 [Gluconacetobacter diazotrophicus]|nr:hypothetical protein [Gluconacetobacter diazotrophicus]
MLASGQAGGCAAVIEERATPARSPRLPAMGWLFLPWFIVRVTAVGSASRTMTGGRDRPVS